MTHCQIITSFAYDPTVNNLYFAYVTTGGDSQLMTYNTKTEKMTTINMEDVISDLAVSYTTFKY
jgi:hypothetical protein